MSNAWAALPLTIDGRPFGVLGISFLTERAFTESERFFLWSLADLGALALACPHDREPLDPATMTVDDPGEHGRSATPTALGRLDNAINHAYAASLGVTYLIERRVDEAVATRLESVLVALDVAIKECRAAALSVVV